MANKDKSTIVQILSTDTETVVSNFDCNYEKRAAYQTEAQLEEAFIEQLKAQGYEYVSIKNDAELIINLRKQIEKLNDIKFNDDEWARFLVTEIQVANDEKDSIVEKTKNIQQDERKTFKFDSGEKKNIMLIDKKNIYHNNLQVINQFVEEEGKYKARYDVTILVNGLPLIHIELKRRGVDIREAFNQIKRYNRDNFFEGSGLFEYVQIFVISNGTFTKYYSNTTRYQHCKENENAKLKKNAKRSSDSFEFTSFWADANNKTIPDIINFTKTFFSKNTILNILTKYCVFDVDNKLLVMRPYQIAATERIINKVKIANQYKMEGTIKAGGYIWHTTGSGKTLTSFKTATLLKDVNDIDKVFFIVDRKDLDYQTMKEYDRFEKGAANGNKNTKALEDNIADKEKKILVTTIQKLDCFLRKNKTNDIFNKKVVMIFDECHRSQFGEMHEKIIKNFKKYFLFGFTGTPIFKENANMATKGIFKTTEQVFGEQLHVYTIVDATRDKNVLPFKVDFTETLKIDKSKLVDKKVKSINTEEVLESDERVKVISKYMLDNFDVKTKRNGGYYSFRKLMNVEEVIKKKPEPELREQVKINGFNSILAVSSIKMAKKYYTELKKQIEERQNKLKIATIFSYSANEADINDEEFDTDFNVEDLDKNSRDFLDSAIADYNKMFKTNYSTNGDQFENYYKDVSQRVKNRDVDILIVVNMFLTGFDATTLNTLWVDKNLRLHGLIQAFSRTNRILNQVKQFGQIVCFRNLKKEVDEAVSLFGDKEAHGIVIIKDYKSYYNGYDELVDGEKKHIDGYKELIDKLLARFDIAKNGTMIEGEAKKKEFIKLYGAILKIKNILMSFDEFEGNEIISDGEFQDYQSMYVDLYKEVMNKPKEEKEHILEDLTFEVDLIKQIEINVDYILELVRKYHASNAKDKELLVAINKGINSSLELRSKKELILDFVDKINSTPDMKNLDEGEIGKEWLNYVKESKENDIKALVEEEGLNIDKAIEFFDESLETGEIRTHGTKLDSIMPAVSLFSHKGNDHKEKRNRLIAKLMDLFDKYSGIF